jgi:DNA-binding XRE family transcriptional regulator
MESTMSIDFIVQDGRERVVLDRSDYEDLVDARDAAIAMRDIAAGAPTIPASELDAYLAAPTPLAFWRQRAGKTQAALAEEVGVSQPFLAQIEGGRRQGTVRVLERLAKAVGVRIEDLLP